MKDIWATIISWILNISKYVSGLHGRVINASVALVAVIVIFSCVIEYSSRELALEGVRLQKNTTADKLLLAQQGNQDREAMEKRIRRQDAAIDRLENLISGGDTRYSLQMIQSDLRGDASIAPMTASEVDKAFNMLSSLPSEVLFGVCVIFSGLVGVMFVRIKNNAPANMNEIALGVMCGFLTYLGIKGGNILLIIHPTNQRIPINITSCAFLAALVGMFLDHAIEMMRQVFLKFPERLRVIEQKKNRCQRNFAGPLDWHGMPKHESAKRYMPEGAR